MSKPDNPGNKPPPVEPPTGDPVSGTFKGTATPTGGEPKNVEGTYSGTINPDTGEFSVMGLLLETATEPPPITPIDPPPEPGEGVSSVIQGNVTLTFASPVEVIENFQGNHFLKGPVTISSISPAPTGTGALRRHGAMVNPSHYTQQSMDGRFASYNTIDDYTVGTVLSPGDSLLCSISRHPAEDLAFLLAEGGGGNPRGVSEYQIFTVVATLPVSPQTFIPPVCGTDKTIFTVADVNLSLLPGLATTFDDVTITQGPNGGIKLDDNFNTGLHKWLVFQSGTDNHTLSGVQQSDVQNWYPSALANCVNQLAVYCMTELSRAEEMALRIIQFGIQQRGVAKTTAWSAGMGAGYGSPSQLSLMFAGWLLEDDTFISEAAANNAAEKYSPSFQYYYSTTSYSGYATGFPPAAWASGPNIPLFGDNNVPQFYGGNNSTRDIPDKKYIANAGIGSDVGYAEYGVRYQAVDAGNTHYAVGGAYMVLSAQAHVGARMWSALADMDDRWGGDKAWIDFCDWFHMDSKLAFSPSDITAGNDNGYYWDIRQSGGVGNGFMLEMWNTYGPFYT